MSYLNKQYYKSTLIGQVLPFKKKIIFLSFNGSIVEPFQYILNIDHTDAYGILGLLGEVGWGEGEPKLCLGFNIFVYHNF